MGLPFLPRFGRLYCSAACGDADGLPGVALRRPGSGSSTDWATSVAEDGDPEARDEALLEPAMTPLDDGTLNWSVAGLRVSRRREQATSLATNDKLSAASSAAGSFDDFPYAVWKLCSARSDQVETAAPAKSSDVTRKPPSQLICPADYMLGSRGTKSPAAGSTESGGSYCKSPLTPTPPPRQPMTTTVYASGHVVANGSIVGDVHRAASPQQTVDDGQPRHHPVARQSSLPDLAEPEAVDPTPAPRHQPPPPPLAFTEAPVRRRSGYHSDSVLRHRGRRHGVPAASTSDGSRRLGYRRPHPGDPGQPGARDHPGRRQQSVYQALMEAEDLTAEKVCCSHIYIRIKVLGASRIENVSGSFAYC